MFLRTAVEGVDGEDRGEGLVLLDVDAAEAGELERREKARGQCRAAEDAVLGVARSGFL